MVATRNAEVNALSRMSPPTGFRIASSTPGPDPTDRPNAMIRSGGSPCSRSRYSYTARMFAYAASSEGLPVLAPYPL